MELGFLAFHFPLEIDDDPTDILMTSSTMEVGQTRDSYSLKISTVSGLLNMTYQYTALS